VGETAKQQQTHPKVMAKMFKKCSTDQMFIWKINTTYEIGALANRSLLVCEYDKNFILLQLFQPITIACQEKLQRCFVIG
jgi:hypothetical protein